VAICIPRKELGTRTEARNAEIKRALALQADFLLMMDADQTMPLEALNRFLQIDDKSDIIIIDAPSKNRNDSNVTYNPDGTVAWTGFSCAMIKTEVFNKIPYPWFDDRFAYTFEIKNGKYVYSKVEKYRLDNVGEDVDFYFKCLEKGIKIKIITDIKCQHREVEL